MPSYTPKAVANLLRRHGLAALKGLGQNFLLDEAALNSIVAAAELTGVEAVLEVGPGLGFLTALLAQRAAHVQGVELDAGFVRVLAETVRAHPNVRIHHADFLKLDLPAFADEFLHPLPATVVANVPYYITSPILLKLLQTGALWKSIVVLVQQEVALRLQAGPGSPDYGSLSVYTQFRASAEIVGKVPRGAFHPAPNVDSAIVRLRPHLTPPVNVNDPHRFEVVVRGAFGQRRKTLGNALATAIGKDTARAALAAAGIDPQRRGETLTMQEFATLSNASGPADRPPADGSAPE
ncbi:MAG TPA: 16S rRNA (adenine(1518)-N(6)/adenine(1519)-N(6))-dimethyltransferase RsmA [Armatimonadota bacterium]